MSHLFFSDLEKYLPQELQSVAFKVSRVGVRDDEPLQRLSRFDTCSAKRYFSVVLQNIYGYIFSDIRRLYVPGQIHVSACRPESMGQVAFCWRSSLGHGMVSYARWGSSYSVRSFGLPSRNGRPALCQQDVRWTCTHSTVGCGQARVQQQVRLKGHLRADQTSIALAPWVHCGLVHLFCLIPSLYVFMFNFS